MTRPPIYKVIYLNDDIDKKIINEYWEVNNEVVGWKYSVQEIAESNKVLDLKSI